MSTQAPHRGVLILVLGILGFVLCPFLFIAAWIMGKGDLESMERGEMDLEGQGLTQAGMWIGIVGTVLLILSTVLTIGFMLLGIGVAGLSAS